MVADWCSVNNIILTVLGSNDFQVMENGEMYNTLSSPHPPPFDTFLTQPVGEKPLETLNHSPPRFEMVDSPQKRRLSPDSAEFDTSFKRRRNSSFVGFETPSRNKIKDMLRTPLEIFSRRKSISSTISCFDKASLNDSNVSNITNTNEIFNHSCSSLQFASTPIFANSTVVEAKDKFDQFKSPSSLNLFTTPKHKSLFKKGFRKSFISDTKNNLKNIAELDPNCSIDDVDVSVCDSSKVSDSVRKDQCSFSSLLPSLMDAEGPVRPFSRLSSSSAIPVLTHFHYFI